MDQSTCCQLGIPPLSGALLCRGKGCMPLFVVLILLSLSALSGIQAHPLDSYATDQYVDLQLMDGESRIIHRIEFAEIPTAAEMPHVDLDKSGDLSAAETSTYLAKLLPQLSSEVLLEAASQPLPLVFEKGEVYLQEVPAPRLKVVASARVSLPGVGSQGLPMEFHLGHRSKARGDRQIRFLCRGHIRLADLRSSEPQAPTGMALPEIREATALVYGAVSQWVLLPTQTEQNPSAAFILSASRPTGPPAPNPFLDLNPRGLAGGLAELTGDPTPPPPQNGASLIHQAEPVLMQGTGEKPSRESWADRSFRGLFTTRGGQSFSFLIFATLLAFIYGAAHALEPGHGKTIVAAYLVGSHGTVFHALLLAVIVTFTHTFSVYILGILALANLDRVQGVYLPWLECGSWALIIGMGLMLFLRYYRFYILGQLADPDFHTHGLGRGHSHIMHPHTHETAPEHSHEHPHDHHHHDHGPHSHPNDHDHDHRHHEQHPHSHTGDHHHHTHSTEAPQVRFWNLLTLGLTGGIVPCPGALFVMMMALTSGRAAVGLYLITVFSIGLAGALMIIGVTMVKSRGLFNRFSPNSRFVQLIPVLSSLVILLVGCIFFINGLMKHGILQVHLYGN